MKIFKFTPVALEHRNWQASIYKGELIVRAGNKLKAEGIAAGALGIATQRSPGIPTTLIPWFEDSGVVTIEELMESKFDPEGEEEILFPAGYNESF